MPGVKHLIDNLVNDVTKSVRKYDWLVDALRNFDALLGKPFYRSRLSDTCFKDTGYDTVLSGVLLTDAGSK